MDIETKIRSYHDGIISEHHRYRSWEHCFQYFREIGRDRIRDSRDEAAVRLGFYLASWGMYRGSSFLLQHAYTVHLGVIDRVADSKYGVLWGQEIGTSADDLALAPLIFEVFNSIRESYRPYAPASETQQASDTLVTKVMLGIFGCLPACDRYFIDGFRSTGNKYSYVNDSFIRRIITFCLNNQMALWAEQSRIKQATAVHYPLMKLADMYFWEIGYERDNPLSAGTAMAH
jgi:hypothetical protein